MRKWTSYKKKVLYFETDLIMNIDDGTNNIQTELYYVMTIFIFTIVFLTSVEKAHVVSLVISAQKTVCLRNTKKEDSTNLALAKVNLKFTQQSFFIRGRGFLI